MAAGSRDIVGYGAHSPTLPWPGGAKLAISLVAVAFQQAPDVAKAAGLLVDDSKMALARRNGAR